MNVWIRLIGFALLATAAAGWLSGCGAQKGNETKTDTAKGDHHKTGDHKTSDHKTSDHKNGDHKNGDHHDKPLTEKDVKMPDTFKAGVTRLEELHKKIAHQIEHGELAKDHRPAEEMALVAKKMKELAQKDVAEESRIEAGELCNEVAGYFKTIDKAAHDGKKAETEAIHKKMGAAIQKLKGLAK